jgi:hypothetical protein
MQEKLFEYEEMKDVREKGVKQQREELSKRSFKNNTRPAFENYSRKINPNVVSVELFVKEWG